MKIQLLNNNMWILNNNKNIFNFNLKIQNLWHSNLKDIAEQGSCFNDIFNFIDRYF